LVESWESADQGWLCLGKTSPRWLYWLVNLLIRFTLAFEHALLIFQLCTFLASYT